MNDTDNYSICVAATFTSEPIADALLALLAPLNPSINFAPYNQIFAQLLDPSSTFKANPKAQKLLLIRPEDWLRYSQEQQNLEEICNEFIAALTTFSTQSSTTPIVALCPNEEQNSTVVEMFNQQMASLGSIHYLDLRDLMGRFSLADGYDPEGNEIGHIPYKTPAFIALAYEISRRVFMTTYPPRKVIALDCDNTIWHGVVGEEGPLGVSIRNEVTDFAVTQMHKGKLLTIASKNEPHDVWAVFEQQPQMSLKKDMIVDSKINWEPKSSNLIESAYALNLGVDSFIFIDDNPIECAEVAMAIPSLIAFNIPKDNQNIKAILEHHWAFDQQKVTDEDRKRTEMVRQNIERKSLIEASTDYESFLASINLDIQCGQITPEDIERAAQLTQRTNQFNSTAIRRSEADIQHIIDQGGVVHKTTVSDKFGSYGFVGLTIAHKKEDTLMCDSFLLSCRVLGKRVENKMVLALIKEAETASLKCIAFSYAKTDRNTPLVKFYQSLNQDTQLTQEGELHFDISRLRAHIENLSVDYSDITDDKKSDSHSSQAEAKTTTSLSIHLQEIALCHGDIHKLDHWITVKRNKSRSTETLYHPPTTPTETQLASIWQKELYLEKVGIDDVFFSIGGESLTAAKILVQMNRNFGVKYPMSTFYEYPTIRELAKLIDGKYINDSTIKYAIRMTAKKEGTTPLFYVPGMFGQLFNLRHFTPYFENERTLYGLQARGVNNEEAPFSSIEEMVSTYYNEICAIQPDGKYTLLGYCSGGIIILELARRLLAAGKNVAMVAMIDTRRPDDHYPDLSPADKKYTHTQKLKTIGFAYLKQRLTQRWNWEIGKIKQKITGKDPRIGKNDLRAWHVADAYTCTIKNFKIEPVDFPVHLFKVEDIVNITLPDGRLYNEANEFISDDNEWKEIISHLSVTVVPGDHDTMLEEPHVSTLTKEIKKATT